MNYYRLYFDGGGSNYDTEGINLHFICPQCKNRFEPNYKPVPTLPATYDFNQKVTFTCPICAASIIIYVALHKDAKGIKRCAQRSDAEGKNGIPLDWWKEWKNL